MSSPVLAKTLLIVDDDALTLRALVRMAAKSGLEILTASTLADARPILQTNNVDVLLTDLKLDKGEGTELLHLVQSSALRTRSILMSGSCGQEAERLAFKLGALDVLEKPFQDEALLAAVKRALDPPSGFSGDLCSVTLFDVLQMYHAGRRSVRIELAGPKVMQIYVEQGQVVHAVCGGMTGLALRQILATTQGRLRSTVLDAVPQRTVVRRFEALIVDALRMNNENRRAAQTTKTLGLRVGPDASLG
jgi:ActR/RegA family two-component response regulator